MVRGSAMSLLFILSIFCSAARTQAQQPRVQLEDADIASMQLSEWQTSADNDTTPARCHPEYFECPSRGRYGWCIPRYAVCDGHSHCGNNSDESFELCGNRSCPRHPHMYHRLVKCEGLSPTTWCIMETWFCDGVDNCGNNWDEDPANCAGRRCAGRRHRCNNSGICIDQNYTCNGYDDCGDLSDENANCRVPRCSAGFVPCPSGRRRCINETWLCDGYDDCGDSSDEDQDNCLANRAYATRLFMNTLRTQCIEPIATHYSEMSERDIWNKLARTDFAETCRPFLTAQECATRLLTSAEYHRLLQQPNPEIIDIAKMMAMVNDTVNFVCRDNVQLFDDHKGCIFDAGIAFRPPFAQGCYISILGLDFQATCVYPATVNCMATAAAQMDCGRKLGDALWTLASKVIAENGCTAYSGD